MGVRCVHLLHVCICKDCIVTHRATEKKTNPRNYNHLCLVLLAGVIVVGQFVTTAAAMERFQLSGTHLGSE